MLSWKICVKEPVPVENKLESAVRSGVRLKQGRLVGTLRRSRGYTSAMCDDPAGFQNKL